MSTTRLIVISGCLLLMLGLLFRPYWQFISLIPEYYAFGKQNQTKILLVHNSGFGERETAQRLKIAATRSNIDLRIVNAGQGPLSRIKTMNHYVQNVIKVFAPSFVLILEDMLGPYAGAPNYVTLTRGGNNRYIKYDGQARLHPAFSNLQKFDALLPSYVDFDDLKNAFEKTGKEFFGFSWFPSAYVTNYPTAVPKKLFYTGGHLWDGTRNSQKYKEFFAKLDKTNYFQVSGMSESWHTSKSYVGLVPIDGKSTIKAIHEAGVLLSLHHKEHMDGSVPTSRIFEAAAANAVIISDKHPFIQKVFGNNVLYIDTEQDADSMFNQVDAHMQWILSHPGEAQQLAANCHAIFLENYTLEQQLQQLLQMHKTFSNYRTQLR